MPTAEFDLPAGHQDVVAAAPTEFPLDGAAEDVVLSDVRARLAGNRYEPARNFAVTYSGFPHPISRRVEAITEGTFFVEWADESETGTLSMEREAVRMMASLLGDPNAVGFITSGGTESNLAALRLMRNNGRRAEPEVAAPATMHFSFRLGAELMGIRLVEIDVDDATYQPRIEDVERAITPNTVGLVCSAPAGSLGLLDPVEAFADLAWRTGLHLHVDAAFGGFILPFMRDLGHEVPPFDLSLRGVSSIMTDGHKLGLLPIATGFFLARTADLFEAIPTERTLIHTTSSTKPGSRAASAWATFRHLGRDGYRRSTAHVLELRDTIVAGVMAIPGMRLLAPPLITVVAFTSETIDLRAVHRLLADGGWGQGYGEIRGRPFIRLSIHPSRDEEHARGFVGAFARAAEQSRRTAD
ncbi:MAG TPA: aminotransferase class V-fold PLP-dependent enzyme [Candidatus Limnocylindrales bacterium]|jgi:tyrosine decarboxylase/aspartate 1-decarboxylase|nr:aminotransferase class V-fold PLP-dependent enzyme [Candidatus Limnocylindrales bacterium]